MHDLLPILPTAESYADIGRWAVLEGKSPTMSDDLRRLHLPSASTRLRSRFVIEVIVRLFCWAAANYL